MSTRATRRRPASRAAIETKRARRSPARAPPARPKSRPIPIWIPIAVGLTAIAVSVVAVLAGGAERFTGHNNVMAAKVLREIDGGRTTLCQGRELVPEGTQALKVSLSSVFGPPLAVTVRGADRRVVAQGRLGRGWRGSSATVPVEKVGRDVAGAQVCVVAGASGTATVWGSRKSLAQQWDKPPPAAVDDRPAGSRYRIDYVGRDHQAWWAYAPTVVRRVGLNSAFGSAWAGVLAILMMLGATLLAAQRLLRDLGDRRAENAIEQPAEETDHGRVAALIRRVPTAAWTCALVAFLSAGTWAIVSPPFQSVDEQDHFAYAQRLAETGRPPDGVGFTYSPEMQAVLHDLRYLTQRQDSSNAPILTDTERARLDRTLGASLDSGDRGGAGTSSAQPPLYYMLEAVPYTLASGQDLLQRLFLMRLMSALLAAVTAMFVFLFVREVLPREPWAWTVGGLAAALGPLFGWASASLNPDALLFAISAALFYCLARALRRGLDTRLAVATGVVLACGAMTKYNFAGLFVVGVIALVAIEFRQGRAGASGSGRRLAAFAGAVALPLLVISMLNMAWDRPALALAAAVPGTYDQTAGNPDGGLGTGLRLIWQFYLPPLPGLSVADGPGVPFKEVWFNGFIGSFGWLKVQFPHWVSSVALIPALIVLALCGIALVRSHGELRRRWLDVALYGLLIVAMLGVVGVAQYGGFATGTTVWYGQSRYLLPLLAPFAVVLALAARGAGKRWGPTAGVAIVLLVVAHDIHSLLLTAGDYYG